MNMRDFVKDLKIFAAVALLMIIGGFAFGAGVALYIKWVVR